MDAVYINLILQHQNVDYIQYQEFWQIIIIIYHTFKPLMNQGVLVFNINLDDIHQRYLQLILVYLQRFKIMI